MALLAFAQDPGIAHLGLGLALVPLSVMLFTVMLVGRHRLPPSPLSPVFPRERAFHPHLDARLEFASGSSAVFQPGDDGTWVCLLLVDTECFTARIRAPEGPPEGGVSEVLIQFLVPQVALTRFSEGVCFWVLRGTRAVGHGQVIQIRGPW